MIELKKEDIILFVLIAVTGILSLFIIKDFIIILLFTLLLVYILDPFYKRIKKIFKFHLPTSLFVILCFILIFLVPISASLVEFTQELRTIDMANIQTNIDKVNQYILDNYHINIDLNEQVYQLKTIVENTMKQIFFDIPKYLFNLFLIIFFYYYFSKSYNEELHFLKSLLGKKRYKDIANRISLLIEGLVYGQILVRFIQAMGATLGFLLIGVESAILWGIATFFAAFLPVIGTGFIWAPLAILTFLKGELLLAIGIIIIGMIISFIDNLLLPLTLSEKTKIGPVVILISIVGGIKLLGLYGILLGPFIVGTLFVLLEELTEEVKEYNPGLRKFIWSDEEKIQFRNLKNKVERENFIKDIKNKYKKEKEKLKGNYKEEDEDK